MTKFSFNSIALCNKSFDTNKNNQKLYTNLYNCSFIQSKLWNKIIVYKQPIGRNSEMLHAVNYGQLLTHKSNNGAKILYDGIGFFRKTFLPF